MARLTVLSASSSTISSTIPVPARDRPTAIPSLSPVKPSSQLLIPLSVSSSESSTASSQHELISLSTTTTGHPPYQTSICNVHITELSSGYTQGVFLQLNITDGGGSLLASEEFTISWGQSVSVNTNVSKLPYVVSVLFNVQTPPSRRSLNWRSQKFRRVDTNPPVVPADFEQWLVQITAGSTIWNTTDTDSMKIPYCSVGGWETMNFLQGIGSIFPGAISTILVSTLVVFPISTDLLMVR